MTAILVTGGAGYIGSHTCVQLTAAGYTPIIYDNFCNSDSSVLKRMSTLTKVPTIAYHGDIRDKSRLSWAFAQHDIKGVIHFAGFKSVGESTKRPIDYYHNNVTGTLTLLESMIAANVTRIVFSSSATVYGESPNVLIREDFPTLKATNPYGRTKLMIENILTDLVRANPEWSITLLRYFNPAGAHPSGTMGEDPLGIPNNLMPYIAQVAVGRHEKLSIFGDDYPTIDGTGVRDYIHVMDLANGHIAAIDYKLYQPGLHIYNLGTGQGYSVLQVLEAFEKACDKTLTYQICPRRTGDVSECWADPRKALRELNWQAQLSLEQMATDTWRWQSQNPQGYPKQ